MPPVPKSVPTPRKTQAKATTAPKQPTPPKTAQTPASPKPDASGGSYKSLMTKAQRALRARDLEGAMDNYQAAVKAAPKRVGAYLGLGRVYMERGWIKDAVEEFQKAANVSPRSSQAWLKLGGAKQISGDNAGAKLAYERYLKLKPSGKTAREIRELLKNM